MDFGICSLVSSLWNLLSKHMFSHIFPLWNKDSCFSWRLDSLLPLFLRCEYRNGIIMFAGYGYYLRGEAVGGANTARASWSCRQHYGRGQSPSLCDDLLPWNSTLSGRTSRLGWPVSRSTMRWVYVRPRWPCLTHGQQWPHWVPVATRDTAKEEAF